MSVFDKRAAYKPFEYPEVNAYRDAINHSYWLVSEWNFTSDINDYHVKMTPTERNAIKNTLLAISQIEVSVKKFWTKFGERFPKAEFEQVGITFGESEVRHAEAYSHLLQVLGLNDDFATIIENPVIKGRVEYLTKYIKAPDDLKETEARQRFTTTLALFALFVENVSLFSQFAIIKSFNKHLNVLKDIDNVVQATMKEEEIHAQFGAWVLNQIKKEFPQWIDDEFYEGLKKACKKAFAAESKIIDWIFEQGDLPFLSKDSLIEFLKHRFNDSLAMIGAPPAFTVDNEKLESLRWFIEEIYADAHADFFHKKPVTYSKFQQSYAAEALF